MEKFASQMALSPSRKAISSPCPAGCKETAHQSINTSKEELRFLAVSTSYRLQSLNIPRQTALAYSQVPHQTKPEGRVQ
jgi:hypothetical protein